MSGGDLPLDYLNPRTKSRPGRNWIKWGVVLFLGTTFVVSINYGIRRGLIIHAAYTRASAIDVLYATVAAHMISPATVVFETAPKLTPRSPVPNTHKLVFDHNRQPIAIGFADKRFDDWVMTVVGTSCQSPSFSATDATAFIHERQTPAGKAIIRVQVQPENRPNATYLKLVLERWMAKSSGFPDFVRDLDVEIELTVFLLPPNPWQQPHPTVLAGQPDPASALKIVLPLVVQGRNESLTIDLSGAQPFVYSTFGTVHAQPQHKTVTVNY